MAVLGRYKHKEIFIDDEAEGNRLHSKGRFGIPMSEGGLRLSMVEALYLLESGRIHIRKGRKDLDFKDLFSMATRPSPGLEVTYAVYRDLKDRGYIIQSPLAIPKWTGVDLWIYERGAKAPSSIPAIRVLAISERANFLLHDVIEEIRATERKHMRLLMAIVDEEGDLTYYEAKLWTPKGRFKEGPVKKVEGTLLGDRVIVTGEGAAKLHKAGFYGKFAGATLHLSLIETAFLMEKGLMTLRNASTGRPLSLTGLVKRAKDLQPEFGTRLRAYKDMKARGLVVKTGFKYGTHFRVYEKDPDRCHARYLIHALPGKYSASWPEISRAVRLAHGVRKDLLFTRSAHGKKSQYLQLKRVRP